MLTSVLHTEKAIEASIQIIDAFVEMSHYLRQNAQLLPDQEFQRLESRQSATEARVDNIEKKMITKEDLSDLMKLFDQGITNEEILILDGQPFKADIAYQQIYRKAKKKITVFDDYKHRSRTGYALHRQTGVSFVFHNRHFESARQKIKYR